MKMMFSNSITNEEIYELPVHSFEGKVFIAHTISDIKKIYPYLKAQEVLGFDTETRPSFKKGMVNTVSLLQFSTHELAFLIRVNMTGLPVEIMDILSDGNIRKVGVAIKDDVKDLQKLNYFDPAGFIDLQQYAEMFRIMDKSLKKLAAIVLGIRISKSQRTSNWENDILTEAQVKYAATDAWASYKIYEQLTGSIRNGKVS